ncbi:hypothetical protein IE53DRAFT_252886 [Violaceomyces palustris]|uniref:Uncharacterized protein n=1 Tax=Violaceomyces palustris TaxID=1673888 RepID=A0ACD0NNJ0_9BASI|nr:hypothetical protein IE53DRAFT_252886 [Violaceomyces palustris]
MERRRKSMPGNRPRLFPIQSRSKEPWRIALTRIHTSSLPRSLPLIQGDTHSDLVSASGPPCVSKAGVSGVVKLGLASPPCYVLQLCPYALCCRHATFFNSVLTRPLLPSCALLASYLVDAPPPRASAHAATHLTRHPIQPLRSRQAWDPSSCNKFLFLRLSV